MTGWIVGVAGGAGRPLSTGTAAAGPAAAKVLSTTATGVMTRAVRMAGSVVVDGRTVAEAGHRSPIRAHSAPIHAVV
jgi:hypothetical protein